ncbi:MAG: diacylglycerol kinase family protein [Verrucomicrobiaceae bacterium]|nr:diacylglycerol kinase family protein [Verrucomicrobiaceae bacterium]
MASPDDALTRFLRGFAHASRGFALALRTQRNMRVHAAVLMAVVLAGLVFRIAVWEWCVIGLASGMVLAAELLNSAIERLADRVSRETEDAIRDVKDMAAGAVLAASVAAAAAGAWIFLPRLLVL